MNTNRLEWIDWAKVLGIWLVIIGHMNFSAEIINYIFSFHMPLFFYLSGYLDKGEAIKTTMQKCVQTLLKPYLMLYLITYLWWLAFIYRLHPELHVNGFFSDAVIKPFLGMLLGIGSDTGFSTMTNIPLWFLVGLFWTKIINAAVVALSRGNRLWVYLANLVIVGLVLLIKMTAVDLWFSFDSALLAFPFFSIGYLIKNRSVIISKVGLILPTFAALGLSLILSHYNERVDINNFNFGKNILLFYVTGFLGTMAIIGLSRIIAGKLQNFCQTMSSGSLLIIAFHGIAGSIVYVVLPYLIAGKPFTQYLNIDFLVSILVMMVMYPVILFAKKYFPVLIGGRSVQRIQGQQNHSICLIQAELCNFHDIWKT